MPSDPAATDATTEATLAKIRALLAKAESTTFDAEAESLAAKAQELMSKHRIDQAMLASSGTTAPDAVVRRDVTIAPPYARAKFSLLSAVAGPNDVRAILDPARSVATLVGFPVDVAVTEELFTSLLVQATTSMRREGTRVDAAGRSRTKRFRRAFLLSYGQRIHERLEEVAEATVAEAVRGDASGALLPALAAQIERVDAAVAQSFPQLRRLRTSPVDPVGWRAGRVHAETADLSAGPRLDRDGRVRRRP